MHRLLPVEGRRFVVSTLVCMGICPSCPVEPVARPMGPNLIGHYSLTNFESTSLIGLCVAANLRLGRVRVPCSRLVGNRCLWQLPHLLPDPYATQYLNLSRHLLFASYSLLASPDELWRLLPCAQPVSKLPGRLYLIHGCSTKAGNAPGNPAMLCRNVTPI